jgi:carbonic anhydrase
VSEAVSEAAPSVPRPQTPEDALTRLLAGNARFVAGDVRDPQRDTARRVMLAEGQRPYAVVLTCADSRVSPELVFDEGLGDLFVVRVAGNTATDPIIVGSIQFSVANLGSLLVFVLGHSRCGAVQGAVDLVTKGTELPGDIGAVVAPILPAVEDARDAPEDALVDAVVRANVLRTIAALQDVDVLRDLVDTGELRVAGGEYDLETGTVELVR